MLKSWPTWEDFVRVPEDGLLLFFGILVVVVVVSAFLWCVLGDVLWGRDNRRASRRVHREHSLQNGKPKFQFGLGSMLAGIGVFQLAVATTFWRNSLHTVAPADLPVGHARLNSIFVPHGAADLIWSVVILTIVYGCGAYLLWYCFGDIWTRRRASQRVNRPSRKSDCGDTTFLEQLAEFDENPAEKPPTGRRKPKRKRWWKTPSPEGPKGRFRVR